MIRNIRVLMVALTMLLLAQPALAGTDTLTYLIHGDTSTHFPTDGDIFRPYTLFGEANIKDDGGGSPVLESIALSTRWTDLVGGTSTCCVGTTVVIDYLQNIEISGTPVTGSGSHTTSISWGTIGGWNGFGTPGSRLICIVNAGPGCEGCITSCTDFVGFEGTGPVPPLNAASYNTDPWLFTNSNSNFDSPSLQIITLAGGIITGYSQIRGYFNLIPTLPLVGLGILGASFLGFGARVIRNRNKD